MGGSELALGELVATGRTSLLYALGTKSVVKVARDGVPDEWLRFEAEMTAAVREVGVPAPAVRDVVSWNDRIAVVFERITGPSMWELIIAEPGSVETHAQLLATIHRDLLATSIPNGLPDMVDRLQRKIADAAVLTSSERSAAHQLAASLPRGAALLHGDLHPGNILLSQTGPVLIDWFDAAIGHPVADISRSSLLMAPSPCPTEHAHLPGATPELLSALHAAYRAGMQEMLTTSDQLVEWDALMAAGRLSEQAHVDDSVLVGQWRRWSASRS